MKEDLIKEQNIKLDLILDIYCTRVNDESYTFYPYPFMVENNVKSIELKIPDNEWSTLKEKLIEDGYFEMKIKYGENKELFLINQKGKLFWNNGKGGYVKKAKEDKWQKWLPCINLGYTTLIGLAALLVSIKQCNINDERFTREKTQQQKEMQLIKSKIKALDVEINSDNLKNQQNHSK
jgi:hypothetical protein